jgi:hypothetical protein
LQGILKLGIWDTLLLGGQRIFIAAIFYYAGETGNIKTINGEISWDK